jgi:hypothetical protein
MCPSGSDDVDAQPGQRVRQLVDPGQREAAGDEVLEQRAGVEPVDDELVGDAVTRNERVAALCRDTGRMTVRQ